MVSLIVQSILIFLTVGMAALLYCLPYTRQGGNLPLSIVLLLIAVHTLTDLTIDEPLLGSVHLHLMAAPLIFAYAPLLYLHGLRVMGNSKRLTPLHFLPFLVATGYYLVVGFSHLVFFSYFVLQYVVYIFLIEGLIGRVPAVGSAGRWLRFFTCSLGGAWLSAMGATVLNHYGHPAAATYLEQVAFTLGVSFTAAIVYYIIAFPTLFMNVRVAVSHQLRDKQPVEPEVRDRMHRLDTLLSTDREFLAASLDRTALAATFDIDPQQLSQEINTHFKLTLPELINQHRIRLVQELLLASERSIKEIYYEVGFSSRSVFNTNFRKYTGQTPSEYRKSAKKRPVVEDRTP